MSGMILSDKLYSAVGYCPKEKEYQENGLLAHATVADIKEKFKDVLVENGMAYTEASEMVDKCCPKFDSGDEDTLTPLGDLTKIFETLRTNGVKTAVCTMDSRDGTMSALDRLGLTSLVDMIMCGDDRTSKPKPAPDNALHICKQLNVCPTETVVIGDTTADTGMAFIAMYIHYKHIKEFNITQMPIIQKINSFSLWLAAFSCIGMSMVANFQGYDNHLASTFSEWFMAISFLVFFVTYYREFQKITISIKVSPRESEIFCPTGDDSRIIV
ncbi:hypothetical protein QZH41_003043 [Actinostola sp. cb2023]|nr:hypothetical protein QZH41_003043 [Actinostola sp. cb2023]